MKKGLSIILAVSLSLLLLAACGKSDSGYERSGAAAESMAEEPVYAGSSDFSSGYANDYDYEPAVEEAAEMDDLEDSSSYEASESADQKKEAAGEQIEEYGSKIIRNASISLDVENLEAFADNLKKTVYDYGGYIESMDINAYDSDYSESRFGYFTARIPSAKLDDFMNIVKDEGTVTAKSESAEDVTLQYVDVEAKIATYEAERDSLMELLDKASSLKDILAIRDKIAEVNYELDSLKRQLKSMQNKISYSTVSVSAKETRSIAGSKGDRTYFDKIEENFMSELEDGLETAIDLLIFIITRLPLFIILALMLLIIVKVIKAIFGKSGRERAERKRQEKERRAAEAAERKQALQDKGGAAPSAAPAPAKTGEEPAGSVPPAANEGEAHKD